MSKHGDDFNAIDPFRIDTSDGRACLAFGSFWSGIKLSELNPETGKLSAPTRRASRSPAATAARSRPHRSSSMTGKFYRLRQLRPMLQGRRLDLQHPRRPRRPDRRSVQGQGRQSDAGGRRVAGAGHDRPLHRPRRAGGGEDLPRATCSPIIITTATAAGASKLQFSPILWSADGWPQLGPLPQ